MKAGLLALREDGDARSIEMEHFYKAVRETTPSITKDTERSYEQLAKKVKQLALPRIGFSTPEDDD